MTDKPVRVRQSQRAAAHRRRLPRQDWNALQRELAMERREEQIAETRELEGPFYVQNDRSRALPQEFSNRADAETYARLLNDRHPDANARVHGGEIPHRERATPEEQARDLLVFSRARGDAIRRRRAENEQLLRAGGFSQSEIDHYLDQKARARED